MYGDLKREIEAKPTGKTAVTYFLTSLIEQPHAKMHEQKRKKKQYPEATIIIEWLDILTINRLT